MDHCAKFGALVCRVTIKTIRHQTIEYAAVVWSPHTLSDIHTVEMLQRKAASCRFVFNNISRFSSANNMLGWDTL